MAEEENNFNIDDDKFFQEYAKRKKAEWEAARAAATGAAAASAAAAPAAAAPTKPNYKKIFNTLRRNNSTLLGKGGFGSVRRTRNAAALKRVIFDKAFNMGNGIEVSSPLAFNNEIAALTTLKNIPSVIQLQNANKSNENGYILTELLSSGSSLNDAIEVIDDMEGPVFKRFVGNLLEGIDAIHSKNYLHLDIKPENIWVFPNGTIKYLDFGLACKMPCAKPKLYGTPGFTLIVPQSADGFHHFTKISDFFSIKKVLENLQKEISKRSHKEFLQKVIDTISGFSGSDSASDALPLSGGRRRAAHRQTRRRRN